jgi:signal transduction histidine kinase
MQALLKGTLPKASSTYRARDNGHGLSLSYDIVVHQHGGTLTIASVEGAFAEFIISVPTKAGGGPTGTA